MKHADCQEQRKIPKLPATEVLLPDGNALSICVTLKVFGEPLVGKAKSSLINLDLKGQLTQSSNVISNSY
jgi:hypothetical protein